MIKKINNILSFCHSIRSEKLITSVWRANDISLIVWRHNGTYWQSDIFKQFHFNDTLLNKNNYISYLRDTIPRCFAMKLPIRMSIDLDKTYWKSEIISSNLKDKDILKYCMMRIRNIYEVSSIKYLDYEVGGYIDKLKSIFYSAISSSIMENLTGLISSSWRLEFIGIDLCLVVRYLIVLNKMSHERKIFLIIYGSIKKTYCEICYGVITEVFHYDYCSRKIDIKLDSKVSYIFFIGKKDDYREIRQSVSTKDLRDKILMVEYVSNKIKHSEQVEKNLKEPYLNIIHQELLYVQ